MVRLKLDYASYFNNDAEEGDGPWLYQGSYSGHVEGVREVRKGDDYDKSYNDFETDLELPLYAVYVTYTDGGTFGFDWYCKVVGAFKTEDEAIEFVKEVKAFKGFGKLSNGTYGGDWNGYFANLESVTYERVA